MFLMILLRLLINRDPHRIGHKRPDQTRFNAPPQPLEPPMPVDPLPALKEPPIPQDPVLLVRVVLHLQMGLDQVLGVREQPAADSRAPPDDHPLEDGEVAVFAGKAEVFELLVAGELGGVGGDLPVDCGHHAFEETFDALLFDDPVHALLR